GTSSSTRNGISTTGPASPAGATILPAPLSWWGLASGPELGLWPSANSFNSPARQGHTSVVYTNSSTNTSYVYVIGGDIGSGNKTNNVQYAQINASGTLGPWTNTTALPAARSGHASVVYTNANGSHLYVIGGLVGSTFKNDVLIATINPDGSLGSWSTNPTSFSTG